MIYRALKPKRTKTIIAAKHSFNLRNIGLNTKTMSKGNLRPC